MRKLVPARNLRSTLRNGCWICRYLAMGADSSICLRPGGPEWSEYDEPEQVYLNTCDGFTKRGDDEKIIDYVVWKRERGEEEE